MMHNPYGPRFWFTYLANLGLMVAVSLLFRYADFIHHLGGTEKQLGLITGIGMFGAIGSRCFQGVAIDHYGAARVWIFSLVLLVACLMGHLTIGSLNPPLVHGLRVLYTVSLAGAFGASITYVSLRAPANRMGEMIGMLGSSGFIGMAIGPTIGDWLFAAADPDALPLRLFLCSAAAAALSLCCAVLATYGEARAEQRAPANSVWEHPLRQIGKYHPGWTLLVGLAMGVGIGIPTTFLSAFAAEKSISELAWFWTPYAVVAFAVRIITRTLADRWGTRPTILTGLACLAASMLAYLFVTSGPSLILPAILGGFGHAFLFPATVAESNHSFPVEYRGLATNLILTMFDIGLLLGQPIFGWTVDLARANGLNGYVVAFSGLATMLLVVAATYVMTNKRSNGPLNHRHGVMHSSF
jgi:MFS family permease